MMSERTIRGSLADEPGFDQWLTEEMAEQERWADLQRAEEDQRMLHWWLDENDRDQRGRQREPLPTIALAPHKDWSSRLVAPPAGRPGGLCPICLLACGDPDAAAACSFPCAARHGFHRECIVPWLGRGDQVPRCPVCRTAMSTD